MRVLSLKNSGFSTNLELPRINTFTGRQN